MKELLGCSSEWNNMTMCWDTAIGCSSMGIESSIREGDTKIGETTWRK